MVALRISGEENWGEWTDDPMHALAAVDLQSTEEEADEAVSALQFTVEVQRSLVNIFNRPVKFPLIKVLHQCLQ